MDHDLAAAYAATDVFKSLNKRQLSRLAVASQVIHHAAGKAILDQGEVGVGFHLILEGTAAVEVGGQARPDLRAGDYFGEVSMIDGKPRSATVSAKTDLTTASLTLWSVRPIFTDEPDVLWSLLLSLCARLRSVESSLPTPA